LNLAKTGNIKALT